MSTKTTPKQLSDLRHQDWVIDVKPQHSAQVAAETIFAELFPEDNREVKVNFLFKEEETNGDEIMVFEAYKDSGSDDYVYLKKRI